MSLPQNVRANPATWKDYLNGTATVATLATLLVMGGKVLEQIERTRADVAKVTDDVAQIRAELSRQQLQISVQQGADKLREEQINTIRRDLDTLVRRRP